MLDRLGKRWIAESTFLSPHVGWHEFEKFNDSTLADFERIPTWVIAGQEVIDAGPLGAVKGGVLNTPGGSTAIGMALEDIPSECGGFEGWSVDNQTEIEKGWIIKADTLEELCTKMAAVDNAPDAASSTTLENVQRILRRRKRPCIRSNRRHARARLARRPVLRLAPVPRRLLHARRPEKEHRSERRRLQRPAHPAPVRRRMLRQHGRPHVRHLGRKQRREHGVGPHRRTKRRKLEAWDAQAK